MSKAETLLKRAVSFERLALYSDRKVFLETLSQDFQHEMYSYPKIEELFKKAYELISQAGGDASALQDAWQVKKDPAALARAISAAIPSIKANLQNANVANELTEISTQINSLQGTSESVATTPTEHADKKQFPVIDKSEQDALFRINTIEGIGLPGKIDGELGPETKKAIEAFKKKFNLGEVLNDAQVLGYAKMMADNNQKYQTTTT